MSKHPCDKKRRRKFLKYGVAAVAGSAALPFVSATTADAQSNADSQTLERATVVQGAHIGNADTVFIAGQLRKWRGRLTSSLLGPDMQRIRQMVDESCDYLFTETKWPLGTIDFSD